MPKILLTIGLISLFVIQANARMSCEIDRGGPFLTPVGLVVTSNTFELKDNGLQIGSDFETRGQCESALRKMKSDKPFVCLPMEQGFFGGVSRMLNGATYGLFGPGGKQYGMEFQASGKEACEQIAEQGTRKVVCVAMGKNLIYQVNLDDGKTEDRTKKVFDGYVAWGSGSQKRYARSKECIKAVDAVIKSTEESGASYASNNSSASRAKPGLR